MQKYAYALRMCIGSAVLAAFGGFLRWLQAQASYEPDTGLAVRGSIWPVASVIWLVIGAVYFAIVIARMQGKSRMRLPMKFADAFRPEHVLIPAASLLFGLIMVVGGLMLLLRTPLDEPQRKLLVVLGGIAALTGLAFPVYLLRAGEEDPPSPLRPALATLPIALFAFWLIVSYKIHIVNPTVSAYAVEILTIAATAIAFFRMAGYAFESLKPARALFWGSFAAFMCLMSLSDSRYTGEQLLLASAAGMLLLQVWLICTHAEKV